MCRSPGYLRGYTAGFAEQLSAHQQETFSACYESGKASRPAPSASASPQARAKRVQDSEQW